MPTATNSSRACSSAGASSVEKCSRSRLRLTALGQAGLVDRDLAALEAGDLVGVDVDAPDLAAELGEAGRGDQADVAGADHGDRFAAGRSSSGRG